MRLHPSKSCAILISVPVIDSCVGLMHSLFTLEDRYGLHVEEADGDEV